MKMLKELSLYCIKVDYFMWSEEKQEYTCPLYLALDDNIVFLPIIFVDTLNDPRLRVFDTERDAKYYMYYIKEEFKNTCSFENPRVIRIIYDAKERVWKEAN